MLAFCVPCTPLSVVSLNAARFCTCTALQDSLTRILLPRSNVCQIQYSRDAQERKRRERAARNQVKKSAPSAKYTLDDDEEDNKSKPTAATRSETEQDLSPLPNPLDVAQVSSAVSAAVISWCCKSCQSYGFQKDRCVLQELKAKNHPASQNVYVSEVRLETPVAWQVHS